jgi:hypothetical protein
MLRDIFLLMACALCGVAGGYYGGSQAEVPAQIAIVDIQGLVRQSAGTDGGQGQPDAGRLAQRIKAATAKLVAQGMVVVNAEAIVNAPEEAYVNVE